MSDPEPDTIGDVAQVVRLGRVTAVDKAAATCRVAIGDPEAESGEVETDDIPWLAIRAGETILWCPPSIDEQVVLLSPNGDIAQAVALPAIYSTAFPSPGSGSRQFVRFVDGAEFGYDPDESAADITLPGGGTLTIKATGGVAIEGDVAVEGKITATKIITSDVDVIARPGTPREVSLVRHLHRSAPTGNIPEEEDSEE